MMYEPLLIYMTIGAFVSAVLLYIASRHPLYRPTLVGFIIVMLLWPICLVATIRNYIKDR